MRMTVNKMYTSEDQNLLMHGPLYNNIFKL